jgi:hypothetical protein
VASSLDDQMQFRIVASEKALAKDWLLPEEDNTWKDL